MNFRDEAVKRRAAGRRSALVSIAVVLSVVANQLVHAATFSSGSNGSDEALTLTTPGTIIFDPVAMGLDTDGDGIFNFTTITIGAGVTVKLLATHIDGPVFWLATGNVAIDGTLDLDGQPGRQTITESARPAIPGAGGFYGGVGSTARSRGEVGSGPGGGSFGCGAGHAITYSGFMGPAYGNDFLLPLVGGSGGGGFHDVEGEPGDGGGAGGGAILIASSGTVTVPGSITANGGAGGGPPGRCEFFPCTAGPGSGGSIHLLAPTMVVSGTLSALGAGGGRCGNLGSSPGRIRVEGFERFLNGTVQPVPVISTPIKVFLPATAPSKLRVVSVGGVSVPTDPTGDFTIPDATINSATGVAFAIEAKQIPPGTVVRLHLLSEAAPLQVIDSTPLVGTSALSTATASAIVPPGFTRGYVRATWGP